MCLVWRVLWLSMGRFGKCWTRMSLDVCLARVAFWSIHGQLEIEKERAEYEYKLVAFLV
jgi:hypothetical protein